LTANKPFEGTVALVTGAASGIGLSTFQAFADQGATVWLVDLDERGLTAAVELAQEPGKHPARTLDVTSEAGWQILSEEIAERHGWLDILVNNAGAARPQSITQMTLAEWRWSRAVNLDSVFLATRAMLPLLAQGPLQSNRTSSAIINVSSVRGMIGGANFSSYCAAKGAVRLFTKAAALEYADRKIRINSIHPGFIETPLARAALDPDALVRRISDIPLARGGKPCEIADAILFLASEASSFMTGAELVIDGGTLAQ
jgi:meso-butanediol dehydrogenase / (S,S)-butanediol dehydrogenase / diacetyl reductase